MYRHSPIQTTTTQHDISYRLSAASYCQYQYISRHFRINSYPYDGTAARSRPRNGGERPASFAPLTSSLPLVPPISTSQLLSAGSGHDYHRFRAFPLLRSNATILPAPDQDKDTVANVEQTLHPSPPFCFLLLCPQLPPPSNLVQ